jgi:hypothetical protein
VDQVTYATELWSMWLTQYAWIAVQTGIITLKTSWQAQSNVDTSAFRTAIGQQVGGDAVADALIARCVPRAKANAEAEAAQKNAEAGHPLFPNAPKLESA